MYLRKKFKNPGAVKQGGGNNGNGNSNGNGNKNVELAFGSWAERKVCHGYGKLSHPVQRCPNILDGRKNKILAKMEAKKTGTQNIAVEDKEAVENISAEDNQKNAGMPVCDDLLSRTGYAFV